LVLAALVALAILVANTVTGSVRSTVEQLLNGSQQVGAASARLSSQSQNVAQGAREKAQKIEEATAALEQMAEVTTRNTETAGKTDEVAKLAHAAATRGAADIGEMDSAIESSRQATILPRSSRPSTKSLSKPTFSL